MRRFWDEMPQCSALPRPILSNAVAHILVEAEAGSRRRTGITPGSPVQPMEPYPMQIQLVAACRSTRVHHSSGTGSRGPTPARRDTLKRISRLTPAEAHGKTCQDRSSFHDVRDTQDLPSNLLRCLSPSTSPILPPRVLNLLSMLTGKKTVSMTSLTNICHGRQCCLPRKC